MKRHTYRTMASVGILLLSTVMFLAKSSGTETGANHAPATKIPTPLPTRENVSHLQGSPATNKPRILEAYGKLPMAFEANGGQTDSRVKFLARGSGYTVFLTPNEAVLALQKPSGERNPKSGSRDEAAFVVH